MFSFAHIEFEHPVLPPNFYPTLRVATGIKSLRQAGTSSDRRGLAQTGGPCSNRHGPCSDRWGLVQYQRAIDLFDHNIILT